LARANGNFEQRDLLRDQHVDDSFFVLIRSMFGDSRTLRRERRMNRPQHFAARYCQPWRRAEIRDRGRGIGSEFQIVFRVWVNSDERKWVNSRERRGFFFDLEIVRV